MLQATVRTKIYKDLYGNINKFKRGINLEVTS
jgi:hypothetical protein